MLTRAETIKFSRYDVASIFLIKTSFSNIQILSRTLYYTTPIVSILNKVQKSFYIGSNNKEDYTTFYMKYYFIYLLIPLPTSPTAIRAAPPPITNGAAASASKNAARIPAFLAGSFVNISFNLPTNVLSITP